MLQFIVTAVACLVLLKTSATLDLSCDVADLSSLVIRLRELEVEYKQAYVTLEAENTYLNEELRQLQEMYLRELTGLREQLNQSNEELTNYRILTDNLQNQINETEAKAAEEIDKLQNLVQKIDLEHTKEQSLFEQQYREVNDTIAMHENIITAFQEFNSTLQDIQTDMESLKYLSKGSVNGVNSSIGFSVYSPDYGPANKTALKFSYANYNPGEVFNMSSGEFVCKQAGLYVFLSTVSNNFPGYCYFFKNSVQSPTYAGYVQSSTHYSLGTSVILYDLQPGDRVYLSACVGTPFNYHSSFTGFMINAYRDECQ